jgi:hypothetical protein
MARSAELEVFICGGRFEFKKAILDVVRMKDDGNGAILV